MLSDSPTSTPPRTTRLHAAAALAAVALLAWGALPYLPGQIDDTYIVFAYAHNIVEHGEIAWNTGVRVEGYSSPLHLALMVLGAFAGADLAIFARVLSFACSAAVVAVLARSVLGPHRFLLVVLLAAWQPFQYWSTAGLETAMATLLGVLAWPLVIRGRSEWARGVMLLLLFSVTRPEGMAWLGVALARRLTLGKEWGRPERLVLAGLTALGIYHLARFFYFGYLLPTPYLVKIAAIEQFGIGVRQLARELASAGGILLATLLFRRRISPWAWAPLLIQGSLLVRAGGDWMGHARFLVPGVAASVAAVWIQGVPRQRSWPALGLVAALGGFAFAWEPSHEGFADGKGILVPGWRNPWFLRHPGETVRTPWAVALLEETSFLIARVPPGAGAAISDVGLPGNLEDVRIWDNAGLTDRVTARIIASESGDIVQEILDRYHHGDDVWCMRYGRGKNGEETADAWLTKLLPEVSPSFSGSPHMVWRCRAGGAPDAEVVAARWAALVGRYPSQDWIRWHYARALLAAGHTTLAAEAVRGAMWLSDEGLGWVAFGDGQSATYQRGRGWALYSNGSRASIAATDDFWVATRVRLDVDDPGEAGAAVTIRWDPPCSPALDTVVHERVSLEPPRCDADPGLRRLIVEFRNDDAHDGFDRNLYVSIERP
ncbi:MAG: hypothetical protein Q8P41_02445 [Pseudomonadota bacterium]|nr:hypothetical protein [Pseudomonadota bacterium]